MTIPIMCTIQECADKTGLSYWCVSQLVSSKRVKFIKSGNRTYINLDSLCKLLEGDQKDDEETRKE